MVCIFAVLTEPCRLDYRTHCQCRNELAHLREEPTLRSVTCNINRCNLLFNSINLSVSFAEITSVITKYRLALWGWNISKIEHHPNNSPCGFYPNILAVFSEKVAPVRSSVVYSSNVFSGTLKVPGLASSPSFLKQLVIVVFATTKMAYKWILQFSEHPCKLDLEHISQE